MNFAPTHLVFFLHIYKINSGGGLYLFFYKNRNNSEIVEFDTSYFAQVRAQFTITIL